MSYYAYRRQLQYPDAVRWTVSDVPAVIGLGRRIASEEDSSGRLSFTDDMSFASGTDVLLASGVLQFLPEPLDALLATLAARPSRLIINRLPLHPTHAFYTLQSIGTAYCPYRVSCDHEFVEGLRSLGYELLDRWSIPDLECRIPFHDAFRVTSYSGFAFASRSGS